MKKVDKIFVGLIIIEVIFLSIIGIFWNTVYWPTPCTTPDFFHPFGREMAPGTVCILVVAPTLNPLIYWIWYLLILTTITYLIYLAVNKLKKFNVMKGGNEK